MVQNSDRTFKQVSNCKAYFLVIFPPTGWFGFNWFYLESYTIGAVKALLLIAGFVFLGFNRNIGLTLVIIHAVWHVLDILLTWVFVKGYNKMERVKFAERERLEQKPSDDYRE